MNKHHCDTMDSMHIELYMYVKLWGEAESEQQMGPFDDSKNSDTQMRHIKERLNLFVD